MTTVSSGHKLMVAGIRVGVNKFLKSIIISVFFPEWSKRWKSTFMFGRCCRGSVVVTSVKNTRDLKILVGTSIKSEIHFMREINGRSFSVTRTTAHHHDHGHRALTLWSIFFFCMNWAIEESRSLLSIRAMMICSLFPWTSNWLHLLDSVGSANLWQTYFSWPEN